MYERGSEGPNPSLVRYGHLRNIRVVGGTLSFGFAQKGHLNRSVVQEFAEMLGLSDFEQSRTHWAVKDGGIPKQITDRIQPKYDLVLSFAGEDRGYVEEVAEHLKAEGSGPMGKESSGTPRCNL